MFSDLNLIKNKMSDEFYYGSIIIFIMGVGITIHIKIKQNSKFFLLDLIQKIYKY